MASDIIKAAEAAGLVFSKAVPYDVEISTGRKASIFLPHEFYPAMVDEMGLPGLCLSQESLGSDTGLPKLLKAWATNDDVEFTGDLSTVEFSGCTAMGCNTPRR